MKLSLRSHLLIRITHVLFLGLLALSFAPLALATQPERQVLLRDITDIEGVRDNQLVGYGLVVGLRGTGDRQQTYFTVQTLANAMKRMGVQIAPGQVVVKNVAAVFITGSLPPFARPGSKLDITVSSAGDAKSLEGGVLLMTSLRGPDGQVYAEAQGPLALGGYSEGTAGQLHSVNHPTVGRIPEGAIVERDANVDLSHFHTVSLMLRNPDFTAARDMAEAINKDFQHTVATPIDSRTVQIDVAGAGASSVPILISRVQSLSIPFHSPAKVTINERTGTIVMGGSVTLSPVSVLHGSLSIEVETTYTVSQPLPFSSGGTTQPVANTVLAVKDLPAQSIRLENGANVDDLIRGLHAIGATSHDIVAILQAIKSAGGLQADLEVI
ncbi:flagellar basal body P-ring protein FlgI [Granulicella tundricola]|uniref:Flagellar P-ring protein n=1 Tax=Granulicella tundricola (strain ATCC BAA-1859 / DSM 23138 / MP5ACTX9) TaxID=1198114 RepID=E8X619_GRATM|nr:flagellar basal body P-ring protein FlgI [Granulicella tundricola]ADW70903.1 flagellar P-ring protein [Granulicella tundricola MP5ACTX9]